MTRYIIFYFILFYFILFYFILELEISLTSMDRYIQIYLSERWRNSLPISDPFFESKREKWRVISSSDRPNVYIQTNSSANRSDGRGVMQFDIDRPDITFGFSESVRRLKRKRGGADLWRQTVGRKVIGRSFLFRLEKIWQNVEKQLKVMGLVERKY